MFRGRELNGPIRGRSIVGVSDRPARCLPPQHMVCETHTAVTIPLRWSVAHVRGICILTMMRGFHCNCTLVAIAFERSCALRLILVQREHSRSLFNVTRVVLEVNCLSSASHSFTPSRQDTSRQNGRRQPDRNCTSSQELMLPTSLLLFLKEEGYRRRWKVVECDRSDLGGSKRARRVEIGAS